MNYLRTLIVALALIMSMGAYAKDKHENNISVEPPFWWAGMKIENLQLIVNAPQIRDAEPSISYPGVKIDSIIRLDSPNYQIIYLNVASSATPGKMDIFFKNGKKSSKITYELRKRDGVLPNTFTSEDVLYLIMPDRFADGDTTNNNITEGLDFPVQVNRNSPNARHGGDLKGIEQHLDYIESLGMTAIWLNPVLENDMPGGSYHGYATTNYYKVDPRFGTNEDYVNLIAKAHEKDMKVVMDMIFNHSGSEHPWMKDMPSKDWYNHPEGDVMTNFRLSTINDPYASKYDYDRSVKGWFVPSMPDLNQCNPHVMKYLIQNSIWWIEYSKIDGIRMDTYPYADMQPMAQWIIDVRTEYPGFNIVGECWYGDVPGTAYWQAGSNLNIGNTMLPTVMDFPTMLIANSTFHGNTLEYGKGLNEIYNRLALDYLYKDTESVLTFLDNHDTDRFLLEMPKNLGSWKQGMAFLLTTRGIPQIYYGTELLMNGTKKISDGNIRLDVPGGFPGDDHNEFTAAGRSDLQNEAYDFIAKLAKWRKGNKVISQGRLLHFMPENGLYVYQRSLDGKRVIVMMNGTDKQLDVDMKPYKEILEPGNALRDVITGETITIIPKMTFEPRALYILE